MLLHSTAFAKPEPPDCAKELLFTHLASKQPFTPFDQLGKQLARRESATLLLRIPFADLRMGLAEMQSLGLKADSGVRILSQFSVSADQALHFVIEGPKDKLLAAQKIIAAHYRAAIDFQVLGSIASTRSFELTYPQQMIEIKSISPANFASLEERLAQDPKTRVTVFLSDVLRVAVLIPRGDMLGVTKTLLNSLKVKQLEMPEGASLSQWLADNATSLREPILVSYKNSWLLSQTALHEIKKLEGLSLPIASQRGVKVAKAFAADLPPCTREVCLTPLSPPAAAAVVETPPEQLRPAPVARLADAYPKIDQPQLPVETMHELARFLRENTQYSFYKPGVMPTLFVDMLDQLAPAEHETHVKLLSAPDLDWGQRDANNSYRVYTSQMRVLTAWRVLADRVLGTQAPRRHVTLENIREVIAKFRADQARRTTAEPAPEALPEAPDAVPSAEESLPAIANQTLDETPLDFTMTAWAMEGEWKNLFGEPNRNTWARRPFARITRYGNAEFVAVQDSFASGLSPDELIQKLESAAGRPLLDAVRADVRRALVSPEELEVRSVTNTSSANGLKTLNELRGGRALFLVPRTHLRLAPMDQQRLLLIPLADREIETMPEPEVTPPAPTPEPEVAKPAPRPLVTPMAPANLAPRTVAPAPVKLPLQIVHGPLIKYRDFKYEPHHLRRFLETKGEYSLPGGMPNSRKLLYGNHSQRQSVLITYRESVDTGTIELLNVEDLDEEGQREFWRDVARTYGFPNLEFRYNPGQGLNVGEYRYPKVLISGSVLAKMVIKHDMNQEKIETVISRCRVARQDARGFGESVLVNNAPHRVYFSLRNGAVWLKTAYRVH